MAYCGLLVGPLLVGPAAQQVGLRSSLFILGVAVGATCLGLLYVSFTSDGVPWELRAAAIAGVSRRNSIGTRN
jgi:hypothetical protein